MLFGGLFCKYFKNHLWQPLEWLPLQAHPLGYNEIRFHKCKRCGITKIEGRYTDERK